MSDDQSFYEIQLNTPHLVAAFLGAVVVGMAVFWFGLVIGRGQAAAGAPQDWQAAAPIEDAAPAAEDPLEFYEGVQEPATEIQPAAGIDSETRFTPADPVDPPPQAQPEPEPATVETPPTPKPVAAPTSGALPQADLNLASGWIVQVRSTTDKASADRLQAQLVADGFPAFVVSAEVQGETYYRVRVGRYRSRTEAATVESRLGGRADIEGTWVTEG